MASFLSTMTEVGTKMITKFLVSGQELLLSRAAAGSEIIGEDQNKAARLVHPIDLEISLGEKSFVEGDPSYMLISVFISNKDLKENQYIRELMLYALDEKGNEFPFAYSWLDGEDTDNMLPATRREDGEADTEHIHDIELLATDQINAVVQIGIKGRNDQTVEVPPDFDNLLMWPGCIRATPPKDGDTWVERIVTKAERLLRAERITVRVGESEYTETYRFYYEDGVTLKESYIVHTTQEEDGTWYEDITREGGEDPPEDTEPDEPVEPDDPADPEEPVEEAQALELELSEYEEGVDLYALIDDELHTVANAEKTTAAIDEEYMVFRIN